MNMRRQIALFLISTVIAACVTVFSVRPAAAQDWFKTGTGLGVTKARLAVPDEGSRSTFAQPLPKTFHDVLWADLQYSGVLDLVSPSFYPLQVPSQPSELKAQDWAAAPANAYMVAYGNLSMSGTNLSFAGFLSDVRNPAAPLALQKVYVGAATNERRARTLAHQFADDIVAVLSGGQPGIAQTKITYVSSRSGNKEIWEMDYDGANAHQLTHLKTIALTPRWSPDAERIALTCYAPYRGIVSAQICIYSLASNRMIAFPRYPGTNSSPAWSPDGSQIAFMSSRNGDPEIYVTNADGDGHAADHVRAGVNTSPAWNPKTGKQMVFVSDRSGDPGAVSFERRRLECAENQFAGHGIRDRPVVVTKWTTARI